MTFENEKQKNKVLSNIAGLLHYGKYDGVSPKLAKLIYVFWVILFAVPMTIGIVFSVLGEHKDDVLTAFIVAGGLLVIGIVFIYLCVKGQKQRRMVLLWLEDAVELKAVTKEISYKYSAELVRCVKIQVNFHYDGKLHRQFSDGKNHHFDDWSGYLPLWKKYSDREIDILYSPKYNQVMILKAPLDPRLAKAEN